MGGVAGVHEEHHDLRQGRVLRSHEKVGIRRGEDRVRGAHQGNDLFAKGKYAQAMAKYTAAVAVFGYWNREQSGQRTGNVVKYYGNLTPSPIDDPYGAKNLIRSVYLNAAQCMRRTSRTARRRSSGRARRFWRSIHRAPRRTTSGRWRARSFTTPRPPGFNAVRKDLARANALAPNDRAVGDAMRTYGAAHAAQTAKDRAAYGAVFGSRNKEGLYAREELERAAASAGAGTSRGVSDGDVDPALRALQNMSEEELWARCKAMGVDLDNPRVVKELSKRAKARKEEEMKAKAREMGIDLGDPSVREMLELLEKGQRGAQELSRLPAWRRWIYHSLTAPGGSTCRTRCTRLLAVSREELSPRFFRFQYKKYSATWY